jgi:hypothetical protein
MAASAGAAVCGMLGVRWPALWIAVSATGGILLIAAACLLLLAFRSPIEIHERYLMVGSQAIPWNQIERLDQTRWSVPLAVDLALSGNRTLRLIYAGSSESCASLLRSLRRYSREALLDGIPYQQFWGEATAGAQLAAPRYPLLRPEDEEEVERMFHRLKSVGRLENRAEGGVDTSDPE